MFFFCNKNYWQKLLESIASLFEEMLKKYMKIVLQYNNKALFIFLHLSGIRRLLLGVAKNSQSAIGKSGHYIES